MKPLLSLYLTIIAFGLTNCLRYGIYQHPMLINSNPYHSIPLKSDSSKSAVYAGGSLMIGEANHRSNDDISSIQATLHRGTNFGSFQAHYGVNGTFGLYRAADYGFQSSGSYSYNPMLNDYLIDSINGTKTFASAGISAGINTVIPFQNGGEWRILGLDFTYQYELDNSYSKFRRKLSIYDANLVEHTRHYGTLGLSSEIIFKINNREDLGYKVLAGGALSNPLFRESFSSSYQTFRTFLTQYLHYNFGKGSFYLQATVGYYSECIMAGATFKIK